MAASQSLIDLKKRGITEIIDQLNRENLVFREQVNPVNQSNV